MRMGLKSPFVNGFPGPKHPGAMLTLVSFLTAAARRR
jgi:hypothetical protein